MESTSSQHESQQALEKVIARTSKTPLRNIFGVFIFIIGVFVFGGGVSVLLPGSAGLNKSSTVQSSPLPLVIVGAGLVVFGAWSLSWRRKTRKEELNGEYITQLYYASKVDPAKSQRATLLVSPRGVAMVKADGTQQVLFDWTAVQSTKWRSIYNRDAYQVSTGSEDHLFYSISVDSSFAQEAAYIATGLLPSLVQDGAALAIVIANMSDIQKLSVLHVFAQAFAQKTDKWKNYFDGIVIPFTLLFGAGVIFTLVLWQCAVLGMITKTVAMIFIVLLLLLPFVIAGVRVLYELLVFSTKVKLGKF